MIQDDYKQAAARESLRNIRGKQLIGIGTGSTVRYLIDEIGKNKNDFSNSFFVPTSMDTRNRLSENGLNIVEDFVGKAEISVDGCDEIDPIGNMIKGGGGALTREKMVAFSSQEMLIIADTGKSVNKLGKYGVPVEILPFLHQKTLERIGEYYKVELRENGKFRTDNGNLLALVHTGLMDNPELVLQQMKNIPGVVEVGIFIGFASESIICGENSCIRKKYNKGKKN